MTIKLKRSAAKLVAGLASALVVATGATHLLGGNPSGAMVASDINGAPLGGLSALVRPASSSVLVPDAQTVAAAPPVADCTPRFDAALLDGAMVRLTLNAPCDAATLVRIVHEGLTFDLMTDDRGVVSADVPALAPIAMFQADLAGLALRTVAAIPDFESYTRVALHWQGQSGLQIHALEFGAGFGGEGHVWAKAPGTSVRAVRARGGFITRLGDPALVGGHKAEIYVFPVAMTQQSGTVRLSVEAEVNAFTCGKTVQAQAMQPDADGRMQGTALRLEIPGCDGIGDILVLKNLLRDMKIASN